MKTASYARRCTYGSIRGRGFDSRRLHLLGFDKRLGFFGNPGAYCIRVGSADVGAFLGGGEAKWEGALSRCGRWDGRCDMVINGLNKIRTRHRPPNDRSIRPLAVFRQLIVRAVLVQLENDIRAVGEEVRNPERDPT